MPIITLPADPDLDQLRRQARELQRAVRAGEPDAMAEVVERFGAPDAASPEAAVAAGDPPPFPLNKAQLVVARRYGFASWPRLVTHVELVTDLTRRPDLDDVGAPAGNPADELLRLGSLNYGHDGPERWAAARRLRAEHPDISAASLHAAAAVADVDAVRAFLARDPASVDRNGGPFGWTPLFYLAYARHDPAVRRDAVLDTAHALLDAGADPNAGYLWHGLPTPFTVLTGVFGEGEQGPDQQPRHPHSLALARLLLIAGADANDGQTLYNRQFGSDDDHLELLFEFGLGRGDGGPWRRRLGDAVDSPPDLLRRQLWWAITHDMFDRCRLLVEHGTDLVAGYGDRRPPTETAALGAHGPILAYLLEQGAPAPGLDAADRLAAAALDADRAGVEAVQAEAPGALDEARRRRPDLMVRAAASGRGDAIALLAELGFDVNALGRQDAPAPGAWESALHATAHRGDLDVARQLLALGADPAARDVRFDATPLGWAEHFDQAEMAALLAPLTPATTPAASPTTTPSTTPTTAETGPPTREDDA